MNKFKIYDLRFTRFKATAVGFALIAVALITALVITGCSRKEEAKDDNVAYYTCTMDPWVKSKTPGKCPKCHMDLVPVMKNGATNQMEAHDHEHEMTPGTNAEEAPKEFTILPSRQQFIGVTYTEITKKPLQFSLRAVGTVTNDKLRHWDFVSRVEGYVQKLEVSSSGEVVEKDQPLLTIYSPDLFSAQREFVDLLKMRDAAEGQGPHAEAARETAERLLESARQRLRLWNITSNQIAQLEQSRTPAETLTLHSPFKGVIQDLQVDQGRRVSAGDHLVDVADLSVVWVWAQFYQSELPLLKKGAQVTLSAESLPNEKFAGKISLVDPFLDDATRTARVRIEIDNPDFKLRPGMYVNIALAGDDGEELAVPVSAVLPTGERNVVFVDKGEGRLEPRFVELGRKYGDEYAVTGGLKEGERVVNSANFLVDAESKVQGALKTWQ